MPFIRATRLMRELNRRAGSREEIELIVLPVFPPSCFALRWFIATRVKPWCSGPRGVRGPWLRRGLRSTPTARGLGSGGLLRCARRRLRPRRWKEIPFGEVDLQGRRLAFAFVDLPRGR